MLSSVLRNERAALVNVQIMRSFVKLRQMVASHEYLIQRLDDLEERYDRNFREVFKTLREIIDAPMPPQKHPLGFKAQNNNGSSVGLMGACARRSHTTQWLAS